MSNSLSISPLSILKYQFSVLSASDKILFTEFLSSKKIAISKKQDNNLDKAPTVSYFLASLIADNKKSLVKRSFNNTMGKLQCNNLKTKMC